jgi:hypothetical protein
LSGTWSGAGRRRSWPATHSPSTLSAGSRHCRGHGASRGDWTEGGDSTFGVKLLAFKGCFKKCLFRGEDTYAQIHGRA